MKVLSIIVTYNPGKWLEPCLKSLLNSSLKTDIIVIDNGSTDNTLKKIETDFKKIKLIKNDKNKGFGAANNQGLKIALQENYDYAFLLNQDAWIQPETLSSLVKVSSKNLDYGVLSPIHLNGSGSEVDDGFLSYIEPQYCTLFSDLLAANKVKSIYQVPFVNAASWLISKQCLKTVGGFNPSFFHYGEDLNYCERVYYHNIKVGIIPPAFIYHDRPKQKKNNPYFSHYKKYYSRMLTLKLSSPKKKGNIYILTTKGFIKHLIAFRFKKAIALVDIVFHLPVREISENKNKSLSKSPSFLKS